MRLLMGEEEKGAGSCNCLASFADVYLGTINDIKLMREDDRTFFLFQDSRASSVGGWKGKEEERSSEL
jgi:hypothetical protein